MRMFYKNSSELYHSDNDEEDNEYNNDKEQYISDYWNYLNNGETYAE